ncbi:hypothetical protein BDV59DRAFT_183777 [Aspergillus ambiguus]|uniref:uncharacterized protein n=1 Tax=Aspergillus ambiguus TaxID=176160 RepID=UPI003CCD9668
MKRRVRRIIRTSPKKNRSKEVNGLSWPDHRYLRTVTTPASREYAISSSAPYHLVIAWLGSDRLHCQISFKMSHRSGDFLMSNSESRFTQGPLLCATVRSGNGSVSSPLRTPIHRSPATFTLPSVLSPTGCRRPWTLLVDVDDSCHPQTTR